MHLGDHRKDWALPDTDCWVNIGDETWVKGRVMSFAPGGYLVLIMGAEGGARKVREYEIRPRDMFSYNKDQPAELPLERRK